MAVNFKDPSTVIEDSFRSALKIEIEAIKKKLLKEFTDQFEIECKTLLGKFALCTESRVSVEKAERDISVTLHISDTAIANSVNGRVDF